MTHKPNYFKYVKIIILTFILLVNNYCLLIAENSNGEKTVISIGESKIINNNIDNATSEAVSNCLLSAVKTTLSGIMPAGNIVKNFKLLDEGIFYNLNEVIQSYKILAESSSEQYYRVLVKVKVSKDALRKKIKDTGILAKKKTMPKILFLISEKNYEQNSDNYWWGGYLAVTAAESAMAKKFKKKGFVIINYLSNKNNIKIENLKDNSHLTKKQAIKIGKTLLADIVIVGSSDATQTTNTMGQDTRSFKGTVNVKAILTQNGNEIANITESDVAVNIDEIEGSQDALFGAGVLAGEKLVSLIADAWQKEDEAPLKIEIVINETKNLAKFVQFRSLLKNIPNVKELITTERKSNQAKLMVDYKGTSEELAKDLMQNISESFGIKIFEISDKQIKIELI